LDLNTILTGTVAASCGLLLLRMGFAGPSRPWGWLSVTAGLLALLGLLWWSIPDQAGFIAGPLWMLLILCPILLSRSLTLAVMHRQWNRATLIAKVLAVLHPMDGLQLQPMMTRVLSMIDQGRDDEVIDELAHMRQKDTPMAWTVNVLQAKARQAWPEILGWVEKRGDQERLMTHPPVVAAVLRALGEQGRQSEMVEHFRKFGETEALHKNVLAQSWMILQLGAFLGRRDIVEDMFDGPLGAVKQNSSEFWRGTTAQLAGQPDTARDHLQSARLTAQHSQLREIDQRLQQPLPALAAQILAPEQQSWLDNLAERSHHEQQFASLTSGGSRATPGTWMLCAILSVVFVIEMQGGANDVENLADLGALIVPVELTPGEWWRRISAGFLHFGALHLTMNLAALMLLGRWLERALGTGSMVACYLLSTLASIGLFPYFTNATIEQPQIVVGASGGVMGLLGALLGVALVGRAQKKSKLVATQLNVLLLLVALQLAFDNQTPMVSSLAHTLGLVAGLLFGLAAGRSMVRRPAAAY
jgi:rhomboid protease GluP